MSNFDIRVYTSENTLEEVHFNDISNFLHEHLEVYGDDIHDIQASMRYALGVNSKPGGFIMTINDEENIIGATVVNKTGMESYIPENILVYIAVHNGYRGKGVGKKLMMAALERADGDVALHVEPNNPARHLYERLGFENKYLEMRYKKA